MNGNTENNQDEFDTEPQDLPPPEAQPKVDLVQLAKIEQELLEKMERKADLKKLEAQAEAEMQPPSDIPVGGEQVFFLMASAIMVISLPFMHYILAIILTIFAIVVSLVAGLASPKQSFSPLLNLAISLIGLLFFELGAIYIHTTAGSAAGFWLYQVLAFLFLFATFFSARSFRKRVLEREPA